MQIVLNSRKSLGLDVDGVLADFTKGVIQIAEWHFGRPVSDRFDRWDFLESFPEDEREVLQKEIKQPGFCLNLPVIGEAKAAIVELKKYVDIYPVTSPYDSPTWCYERDIWLKEHFGFHRHVVIRTHSKFKVDVDALLDDKIDNILEWKETYPTRLGLLFPSPYTDNKPEYDTYRVKGWADVIERVRNM